MPFDKNEGKGKGKQYECQTFAQAVVGEAFVLWMGRDAAFRAGRITEVPSIWEIADMAEERAKLKWPELK